MNWDSLPTIETPRMRLRWMTAGDVDALYRIFSHPEVMRYWGAPPLADREAAAGLLAEIQENFRRRSSMKWGIAESGTDRVIGTVTLFNLNLDNRRAEIGYGLDRDFWRQGYMNEALAGGAVFAFDVLSYTVWKQTLIRVTWAQSGLLRSLGFNAKVTCESVGTLTGKYRMRIFMVCCDLNGKRKDRSSRRAGNR